LLSEQKKQIRYGKPKAFQSELYDWQKELCNCTESSSQVLAMCANQIGKTTTGAFITGCHLTGRYPEWWKGHRFDKPIAAWACGVSNETTRDILQYNLLGPPGYPDDQGTMFIPRDCIISTVRKPQVPNAVQTVYVKHYNKNGKENGASRLDFKAYEQGEEKFMGRPMDWIWLDEQPSAAIYTQCITRTVATGGIVMMTFTPEDGMTPTIYQFMHDKKKGQYLLRATWDDAPHLNEERKAQLLAQYPPHEAKMRAMGIPVYGKGLVFPIPDDDLIIDPIELPDHWPRLAGIDFGYDHPTAVVWMAWDRETDTTYLYHEYKQRLQTPQMHAPIIRSISPWVPLVWPHDGNKHNPGNEGAITTADLYRKHGLKMTIDHFRNPIAPGEKGKGNINREPGLTAMLEAMEAGRFKVFSNCVEWFKEKQMYYRDDDGKIVDTGEDLMSATRYAYQSRHRFATTKIESDIHDKYSGKALPVNAKGVV
jgi:phage terminase large subunit-like protein